MEIAAITHIGKVRDENQDAVYVSGSETPCFAIVADGMGGHSGGSIASAYTIDIIKNKLAEEDLASVSGIRLKRIVEKASHELWKKAEQEETLKGMGTTVAMALIQEGRASVINIGDSRVYILEKGELRQITKDHSYVQTLVDSGEITEDEARVHPERNIIMRAVGMKWVFADVFACEVAENAVLLLCSDGLVKHVRDERIKEVLETEETAAGAVNILLNEALQSGGTDNISIIVAKCGEVQHG